MGFKGLDSDYVLSNGALVDVKTRRDKTGANVISELHVLFPKSAPVPPGGLTARSLREIPLGFLANEAHAPEPKIKLDPKREEKLLELLHQYPRSPGRRPIDPLFLAATAYFYEKFLSQKPYTPNATLAEVLDVPVRTIGTRVAKARSTGYLGKGESARLGGGGRGSLTPSAVKLISQFFEGKVDEH